MMMIVISTAIVAVAGVGVYLTERIDRPLRRQHRLAREAARQG